jgi:hypothetical protein
LRSGWRGICEIPKHRNLEGVAMESSHDGAVKRLNGHGAAAIPETAAAFERARAQSDLVDELAQAMGMARESLERASTPVAAFSPGAASLPAIPPPRHLFDDEEDDAAVPIPSTWRSQPEPTNSGTLREQLRAAALGFGTGLAVIVPLVLLLTGRLGDLSIPHLVKSALTVTEEGTKAIASPGPLQQRSVTTSMIVPAAEPRTEPPAVATPVEPEPKPAPKVDWESVVAEGRQRIAAGDIAGARSVLERAAAADNPEALLALAETYDPIMLAAWGVRGADANAEQARRLYAKALQAGVDAAGIRLRLLQ